MPNKADAIASMLSLLALYPPTARIFVNCWTWGYEPLLLALLGQWPDERLHVDRYKRGVYEKLGAVVWGELEGMRGRIVGGKSGFVQLDGGNGGQHGQSEDEAEDGDDLLPILMTTTTTAADRSAPAKLHACDSRRRCEATWRQSASGSRARFGGSMSVDDGDDDEAIVVAINPAEMRLVEWDLYEQEVRRRLAKANRGDGEWPISLVRPSLLACVSLSLTTRSLDR